MSDASGQTKRQARTSSHTMGFVNELESLEPRVMLSTSPGIDFNDPNLQAMIGDFEPPPLPDRPAQPNEGDLTLPRVEVSTLDATASEAGNTAVLEFRRTGSTTQPLTITYNAVGTANTDSQGETVIIEAGQTTRTVTVTAFEDDLVEGTEFSHVVIAAKPEYVIDEQYAATIVVLDNDFVEGMPIISVLPTLPEAFSSEHPGAVSFVRHGDLSQSLEIPYIVTGSAVAGEDYEELSGVLTMPAGSRIANLLIVPKDDRAGVTAESVNVTLDFASSHAVSVLNQTSVSILPHGAEGPALPQVTIDATQPIGTEDGNHAIFTVTRTGPTDEAMVVEYAIAGTATNGVDYAPLTGAVIIAPGATSAEITVVPTDDSEEECSEVVQLSLMSGTGYVVGGQGTALAAITDNDLNGGTEVATILDIGDNGIGQLIFTDANGNEGRISLRNGQGTAELYGDGITFEEKGKSVIVHGQNVRVESIDVTESTDRTSLQINGKGDSAIVIGHIRVEDSLRMLRGKNVDVLCEIWIGGSVRQLMVGSMASDHPALLWIGGSDEAVNIRMANAHDLVINSKAEIRKLMVDEWTASEDGLNLIVAPSVLKLMSRGDFSADVRLHGESNGDSMKTFMSRGTFSDGSIIAASSIKTVRAGAFHDVQVLAGVSADGTALPIERDQFVNRDAEIRNVRTIGRSEEPNFSNSIISAWNMGSVNLREVQLEDEPFFGLSANSMRNFRCEAEGEQVKVNRKSLVPPIADQRGNFVLRLVV